MTPSPRLGQAIHAGLCQHMTSQKLDAVHLQNALSVSAKTAHAIYRGQVYLSLEQVGTVADWLKIAPHELVAGAYGQVSS
jgi:hypothetical protein